ncbi:bcl-2-like protein 15 [Polyodon spathula]|uniref:bcl-2-like protein 15 n=1 Tax=Polyodon spathula TaxID=7913 RepID=UPI001B7F27A9|nr:bcl-2-like protein 15 [Polyodon spathula]
MAPKDIECQTELILNCLFEDESKVSVRAFEKAASAKAPFRLQNSVPFRAEGLVADGPEEDDSFDPVIIADQLRSIADQYNDAVLQPMMDEFLTQARMAAADQLAAMFSQTVDHLSKNWASQGGDVRQEMCALKAATALGLYARKKCPELSSIRSAMAQFVNTRLGDWIAQQGGWGQVASR